MSIFLLIIGLILAQGKGFVVVPENLQPYWQAYVKTYGRPTGLQAKEEILKNYLGDYLILKRAKELKVEKSRMFISEWRVARKEVARRCAQEKVREKRCRKILASVRKLLLIAMVVKQKILPKIHVSEEEVRKMLQAHKGEKRGLSRQGIVRFLEAREQSKGLHAYIDKLMKRYHVTINQSNLKNLDLGVPPS